jgi:hypothetical protein
MKYEDIRPNIRSGDLLAFSHGDWRSWSGIKTLIVRAFTLSTYSHVGVAWVVAGRVFVLEAVKPKVRIYPLSLSGDFYLTRTDTNWTPEVEQFAMDRIGFDYSELKAMYAYLFRLPDGDVSECAAYVREVLKVAGIDLGEVSRPDAVVTRAQINGITTFVENGGTK